MKTKVMIPMWNQDGIASYRVKTTGTPTDGALKVITDNRNVPVYRECRIVHRLEKAHKVTDTIQLSQYRRGGYVQMRSEYDREQVEPNPKFDPRTFKPAKEDQAMQAIVPKYDTQGIHWYDMTDIRSGESNHCTWVRTLDDAHDQTRFYEIHIRRSNRADTGHCELHLTTLMINEAGSGWELHSMKVDDFHSNNLGDVVDSIQAYCLHPDGHAFIKKAIRYY